MAHWAFPSHVGVYFAEPLHTEAQLDIAGQSLLAPFVVVITGASRGIGRATAEAFAKAGATGIILTARAATSLEDTKNLCLASAKVPSLKVSTLAADAGSEEAAKRIAETVSSEHGRLDLLINNAGVVSTDVTAFGKLGDANGSQIRTMMEVNYFGRFYTTKYLLPLLLESPGGAKTVINITSIASHLVGMGAAGFNISDMASNRLTEVFAETYADQGLVFYSLHPGTVVSTLPEGIPAEPGAQLQAMSTDDLDLCGSVCLWLVEKRPEWLSGRYISSEWDLETLEGKREEILQGDKLKARMVV